MGYSGIMLHFCIIIDHQKHSIIIHLKSPVIFNHMLNNDSKNLTFANYPIFIKNLNFYKSYPQNSYNEGGGDNTS